MFSTKETLQFLGSDDRMRMITKIVKQNPGPSLAEFIDLARMLSSDDTETVIRLYVNAGHLGDKTLSNADFTKLVTMTSNRFKMVRFLWDVSAKDKQLASECLKMLSYDDRIAGIEFFNAWQKANDAKQAAKPQEQPDAGVPAWQNNDVHGWQMHYVRALQKENDAKQAVQKKQKPDPSVSADAVVMEIINGIPAPVPRKKLVDLIPPVEKQDDWDADEGACVICQDKQAVVTLDPCGHRCVCTQCLHVAVGKDGDATKCFICNALIQKAIRTY